MWIRHGNGNIVLVLDEAHITRLLTEEGGQECADPRTTQETVQPAQPIDIHAPRKAKRPVRQAKAR